MNNYPVGDEMMNMTQYYTGMITQTAPQQAAAAKPKRRRRKNKDQNSEGVMRKRKLTEEQVNMLEIHFGNEHKLESDRKDKLALELGLDARQVAVWFQNRRARWKSQKMESEYNKLKADHENTIVEKIRLETEVLRLKEQLSESEKETQRMCERYNGVTSNSPGSSFSMETMSPQYFDNFGIEGIDNIFYERENNIFYERENYVSQGMDWYNLYI